MIYTSADEWLKSPHKRALLFAMSGLGKTHTSAMLREAGNWFHYSIDYRIGTRYMGEYIDDNFKRRAMRDPFLADLLRSDSLSMVSNITFENLKPLSTYLGKPGDEAQGGIDIDEYRRRQAQHHRAEVQALLDTPYFIDRAVDLYGYEHFICDTGGSICEVVDPNDPDDEVMKTLAASTLMIWIEGSDAHTDDLVARFDRDPKPMCYQAAFLDQAWADFLAEQSVAPDRVNPNDFIRWAYARALANRQPIYRDMAKWGVSITADEATSIRTPTDFETVVASALDRQTSQS